MVGSLLHEPRRGVSHRPVQLRPGQQGFAHISHTIDERNPKIALGDMRLLQAQGMKHSWLKDKWASLSLFWIKASEHTPCAICKNYQVEEEQPPGSFHYFRSVHYQ